MSDFGNNAICVVIQDILGARKDIIDADQPVFSFEQVVSEFGRKISREIAEQAQAVGEQASELVELAKQTMSLFNRYASFAPVVVAVPPDRYEAFNEACQKSGRMVLPIRTP